MPLPPLDVRIEEIRRQPGRTWGLLDAVVALLAVPVALAAFVALVGLGLDLPSAGVLVVATVTLTGLAALAGRRAARQSGGWGAALGLDLPEWHDSWRVVGWTVLLLVVQTVVYAVVAVVPALRDVEPQTNVGVLEGQPLGSLLVLAIVIVTVAPVVEEVLFRGVALRGLMLRFGFWPAALVSTAFFAALHVQRVAVDALAVVAAVGALGLGLCVLTRRTGRLGPAIGVHALYNATVLLFTVLRDG